MLVLKILFSLDWIPLNAMENKQGLACVH